jgi:hypothetical protein
VQAIAVFIISIGDIWGNEEASYTTYITEGTNSWSPQLLHSTDLLFWKYAALVDGCVRRRFEVFTAVTMMNAASGMLSREDLVRTSSLPVTTNVVLR